MINFKMVNYACLISAVCFIVSNSMGISVIVKDINWTGFDNSKWKSLDPNYLIELWDYRSSVMPLFQAASLFDAFGWLFMTVPIIQLAWALSYGGKRLTAMHTAIAAFAIIACFTEVTSRLLFLGSWGSAHEIYTSFNLENWVGSTSQDLAGWRSLEVNWMVVEGLLQWVDAFEWICLFSILTLVYISVGTQMEEARKLPMWWARIGLLISFLTIIDFTSDLLHLEEWVSFAKFSVFIAIANTLVLLPIWLVYLAFSLHKILPEYSEELDIIIPLIETN